MNNPSVGKSEQELQIDLLRKLHQVNQVTNDQLETRIKSFEMAFKMQMSAPEAIDLSQESESTRNLYGMDGSETDNFARQCILARRLAERGVRFIQVSHANSLPFNNEQWDQHSHLEKGHSINVRQIDKPITGLIKDLRQEDFWMIHLFFGEVNSAGLQQHKKVIMKWVVTITPMVLQCGWQAVAFVPD